MQALEERRMLSTVTSVSTAATWMSAVPGSTPLTDISIPGTVQSAAGASLQNALFGTGSSSVVNPPSALNDSALGLHLAASTTSEAAILAGGDNPAANGLAIAANTAALGADAAAGATDAASDAGVGSDAAGVASAIASALLSNATAEDAVTDAAAATANTAAEGEDTAAETDHSTAGAEDEKAGR